MRLKLFKEAPEGSGYTGVNIDVERKACVEVEKMIHDGKMVCSGCRRALRGTRYYLFSQFMMSAKYLVMDFVCDACVEPVQKAIAEVMNRAEQARPNKEKETAVAGAGGGP